MEENLAKPVHKNRGGTRRIWDVPIRNLVEGVIETLIVGTVIFFIPFIPQLKIMLIIAFSMAILIINIMGFRNRSWTEILFLYIRYRCSKKTLKLRSATEHGKSRVKKHKAANPYVEKVSEYLDDSNLEKGNDIKRVILREIKGYLQTVADSFR